MNLEKEMNTPTGMMLCSVAVRIAEEYAKQKSIEFLDSIRDYEHESGSMIHLDERSSKELYEIHLTAG